MFDRVPHTKPLSSNLSGIRTLYMYMCSCVVSLWALDLAKGMWKKFPSDKCPSRSKRKNSQLYPDLHQLKTKLNKREVAQLNLCKSSQVFPVCRCGVSMCFTAATEVPRPAKTMRFTEFRPGVPSDALECGASSLSRTMGLIPRSSNY